MSFMIPIIHGLRSDGPTDSSRDMPESDGSFEIERDVVYGDLEFIIDRLNELRIDMGEIADMIEQVATDIVEILLPCGLSQGSLGDNSLPGCFEERCRRISLQIREYGVELRMSPNLAYAISYGLLGISFLVGSLTLCDCHWNCDPYSTRMETNVTKYTRQIGSPRYFMPNTLAPIWSQIETNFQLLLVRPTDCLNCLCLHCCTRRARVQ